MFPAIIDFAKSIKSKVNTGHALEVGAYDVNGSVRPVFEDKTCLSYVGIDMSSGPRVDMVLSGHDILSKFKHHYFDTVICCEMLEHDDEPWTTVWQMKAVLKSGGWMFVSTPTFGFPEHRYPIDCFRYGKDAFERFIFKDLKIEDITTVYDYAGYPVICCLGRKP